jgi:hypothetical protein
MTQFTVSLRQIVDRIRKTREFRIHITTIRGMCANGALKEFAVKNGNHWEVPDYVAEDFVTSYVPYGNPPWHPSIKTRREFNRRRKETQTAQQAIPVAP